MASALCASLAGCSANSGSNGATAVIQANSAADANFTTIAKLNAPPARLGALPDLGVAASPSVVADGEPLPKGGGRYQVGRPYQVAGTWYKPKVEPGYDRVGPASWYGGSFHGRLTANGEVFDAMALSAAHPTLPLPSYVRVTNLENDRSIIVRVNDRGPFRHKRLIDVSQRTAELLGFKHRGKAEVRVQYVEPARLNVDDGDFLLASYNAPDRDNWSVAEAAVPRHRSRAPSQARPPVQVAALAPAGPAASDIDATTVSFAAAGAERDERAFEAVTAPYQPQDRILMAFETASQAE